MLPAVHLLHVPLFYGVTFSACAKFGLSTDADKITNACLRGGFAILEDADAGPGNMSAAGESGIQVAKPEARPLRPQRLWVCVTGGKLSHAELDSLQRPVVVVV